MRMKVVVLTILVTGFGADSVHGQIQKFPYRAVVVHNDALVRCGGNDDYYPTQRLQRDAVVTVHRHDPGGWLAIEPPEGSFSWIRAQYVDRNGPETGTVTEDDIIIFVGSEFGDEASVWQRRLSSGTPVRILGEQEMATETASQKMYKIAPPARERRWIAGDAVVPVDEATRREHDRDPFRAPSSVRSFSPREADAVAARPAPSARLQRINRIRAEQRELAEIDRRFRAMLDGNPTTWNLQSIESAYNELRNRATWPPVAGQIDLRFPAIDRYRQRKADYDDFKRLTSETERRDAELIASQFNGGSESVDMSTTSPEPRNMAISNPHGSVIDMPSARVHNTGPHIVDPPPLPSSGIHSLGASEGEFFPHKIRPDSRYIGAGIVQRSPEGGYVLASSNGRKLATLEGSDSVMLEEFVGKPVGLHGKRWYRDDIDSDYIQITGLEAVRIR